MKTKETALDTTPRELRFGEVLYRWIKFLNITVEALAKKAKMRGNYITALKRGATEGGINKPTKRNFDRLLLAIESFYKKPITMERFWDGPPSRNFESAPPAHTQQQGAIDLPSLLLSNQTVSAGEFGLMTENEKRQIAERLLIEVELLRRRMS